MTVAVIAEKPAVARDIASVLGATTRGDGRFEGGGYVVTWAIGHLVALAQPHEIDPAWKRWDMRTLPMLPRTFPLVVVPDTKPQFDVVSRILTSRDVTQVVCATDAGREGELIFRYVYEASGCDKPVSRLWVSSLTPDAIRDGFRRLKSSAEYDGLADAARGRSRADWLVGMNLSRAYSLRYGDELSVGRVQTPTLAMLVERENAIRAFVPEDYLEVVATFAPQGSPDKYQGIWFRAPPSEPATRRRLPADGLEAGLIVDRVRAGRASIEALAKETRKIPPPLLYDLTELQRHANRLYGMSAQRTLDVAQALYERHKLLSYPRTDSRHLSSDVEKTLADVVSAIGRSYEGLLAPGTGGRLLGKRFVDDSRVGDHHAIIPTAVPAREGALSEDERRIYDLVCRRLLSAWHGDHVVSVTNVTTRVESEQPEVVDRFESRGTLVDEVGWRILDVGSRRPDEQLPSGLARDQAQMVLDAKSVTKRTTPPARFTEGTLLTAMETAGRTLEEKELSQAMRDSGLGTPATRAQIIETLLRRAYVIRNGKTLEATDKGIRLVEVVHPDVKSPAMTGEWEAKLRRMQRGEGGLGTFMGGIESYVADVVGRVRGSEQSPLEAARPVSRRAPTPPDALHATLQSAFGFSSFRPFQEAVCRAATEGRDLLLVMPTGAGKSLCYQLPAIARTGTALVVSPLIALMEDQVAKLCAQGFRAERIHSGRDRLDSRRVSREYLEGKLDFLFIAPERLKVPGFPEMLARVPLALVAIDEAHCISQWGHDFRPEYRMLGQRLPSLRPAPIVALTATATPRVQDDIIAQLGLVDPARFIHGFRRHNLAIEVVDMAPSARHEAIEKLLAEPERLPAIVYAATRKSSEEIAAQFGSRAAVYHAGMDARARDRVHGAFLGGEIPIIVATNAFGMGIDKADIRTVVHAALPGSLEAYYQEIGRAGRDAGPSSAVLMCSFVDTKTHDFFLERDYPDVSLLDGIVAKLGARPIQMETLLKKVALRGDELERALERLRASGGIRVDQDGKIAKGSDGWRAPYLAQRKHRQQQIDEVMRFTGAHGCRMLHMIRHFGDREDSGAACGVCDVCAPERSVVRRFRDPSAVEAKAIDSILSALRSGDGQATGKLHRDTFPDGIPDRRTFEHLLGALARAGRVRVEEESFEKDGKEIVYQRVWLTPDGRAASGGSLSVADEASKRKRAPKGKGKGKGWFFANQHRGKKGRPPRRR